MTTELNKRAWHIRRITAKRLGCGVMDVMWGKCMSMAREALRMEAMACQPLIIQQTWKNTRRTEPGLLRRTFNTITGRLLWA